MRKLKIQQIQSQLNHNLGQRLIQLTHTVENFADHLKSQKPKDILNFTVDLFKPYLQSLGLRIAKLSEENIEVVLPQKFLFENYKHEMDLGAITSAAVFGFKKLWQKNAPQRQILYEIQSVKFDKLRPQIGTLHLRAEFSKLNREVLYSELFNNNEANQDFIFQVYNSHEHLIGQVHIQAKLKLNEALDWKKSWM